MANAVDSIPKILEKMLQASPARKVKKQVYNFENMIKEIMDNQKDLLKI
jgi:DNA-binding ferritin-like protein